VRPRIILQSEAAECGLAALAIVANAHGMHTSLVEMRQRFPLSLKGAKLNHLIHIAQSIGLQARPLRLELGDLDKLKTPCILHWDLNHFVVLTKVSRQTVTVLDPAVGERSMRLSEASSHFTGIALELTTGPDFEIRKAPASISLRQLTGRVEGLWRALTQILLLSVALQVFVLLAPFLMQWVVDQVLVSADRDLLFVLAVGFGLAMLLQVVIGLLRGWSVIYLSSRLGLQWMGNVFAHLLRLPLNYFEKRHLGDVTSRMGSVQAIQRTLTSSFVEAIIDGLMAVVTLGMMLLYSWKLALVTLVAVGLYCAIRAAAFRPVRDGTERQLVAAARQQTHLLESLRGIQSLKVANQEPQRRSTFQNLMFNTVNHDVKLARMGLGFNGASQLVFGAERVLVIWVGALLALQNVFSVGMLIAYLAYKDQFSQRMSALIDKWIEFRMLRLHGERLSDIALSEPEPNEFSQYVLPSGSPRVVVENLSFRYADGEPWILKGCSFSIEAGESVAIVGASGCGKSTLVKLILGLLDPSEGTINVGGSDISRVGPRNVRTVMGVVMQDDQLFAGSIADNISFFDSDSEVGRIEAAARLAAVHDEISSMPMGYHSLIGDMGSSLSGGQKQRIVLARALYRKPKLLLLDEATSHLDVTREQLVNDAVRGMKLTKIIIAHRPETIRSADRVLVMEGGRIVQELRPQPLPVPAGSGETHTPRDFDTPRSALDAQLQA